MSYRHSPLSMEGTPCQRGGPRAGDRLPDQTVTVDGRSIRLHKLLARPGVQVLLGRDADRLGTLPAGSLIGVHRLAGTPGRGLTAVRPDGYIGFRGQIADASQLAVWLSRVRAGGSEPRPRVI